MLNKKTIWNRRMSMHWFQSRSEPALPSRVVHLRNIEASDFEVVQLGLPFGRVTNFLNLKKKSQVKSADLFSD